MKKRNFLVITLVITMLVLLVGCSAEATLEGEWVLVSEKEILSAKVESRPLTNGMGGVRDYRNYITYCYVNDNGTVGFDEHCLFENYSGYIYEVQFKYPSEEDKVVVYSWSGLADKTFYFIYLTQESYEQIFNPQNGGGVN